MSEVTEQLEFDNHRRCNPEFNILEEETTNFMGGR